MQLATINQQKTMSSREIAELLEKQHGNIKISAERLAEKGVIGTLAVQEFTHNGNTYTEYLLNKRDSLILVAQNCPEFTARIVDRWQELEQQQAPKLPQTFAEALRLAAEQAELIEQQRPAVEFVQRYTKAEHGSMTFRQVCKNLKANEARFREFLFDNEIMYRLAGNLMAHQNHIDAGRFEVTTDTFNSVITTKCHFTGKGVVWISEKWAKSVSSQ